VVAQWVLEERVEGFRYGSGPGRGRPGTFWERPGEPFRSWGQTHIRRGPASRAPFSQAGIPGLIGMSVVKMSDGSDDAFTMKNACSSPVQVVEWLCNLELWLPHTENDNDDDEDFQDRDRPAPQHA
jgi:hypothetical protein